MKFAKIIAIATLFAACAAQAQHNFICTPVGLQAGNGPVKPFSGKKVLVNAGAFKMRTETENFAGNGREEYNNRGEKYYAYNNVRTGENAVLVFNKDGSMSLIAAIDNNTLFTTCSKI